MGVLDDCPRKGEKGEFAPSQIETESKIFLGYSLGPQRSGEEHQGFRDKWTWVQILDPSLAECAALAKFIGLFKLQIPPLSKEDDSTYPVKLL